MCFFSMPKPKEPPPPPNKLDAQTEALRREQRHRAGGTTRSMTDVTQGKAGNAPVYTPAAGNKTILGT